MERGSESISDRVLDIGSRSAPILLMTLGNAAASGPSRGKRGTVVQNRS